MNLDPSFDRALWIPRNNLEIPGIDTLFSELGETGGP